MLKGKKSRLAVGQKGVKLETELLVDSDENPVKVFDGASSEGEGEK